MSSPILNQIGTVFIPVSNIEQARDWYCELLDLPIDVEILFGHDEVPGTHVDHKQFRTFLFMPLYSVHKSIRTQGKFADFTVSVSQRFLLTGTFVDELVEAEMHWVGNPVLFYIVLLLLRFIAGFILLTCAWG